MIAISNIWKHPRTSVAGVLISVATVAGVLAQQGLTLGTLGGGSVVSLAGALATALLGLLAHDPASPAPAVAQPPAAQPAVVQPAASAAGNVNPSATAKLGVWLLIVLLMPLPWLQGCTGAGVAQDIVNWTPSLQSAVATVDATMAALAPADAAAFASATGNFDAASNLLVTQAKAYLANPSNATLAKLQAQVVAFQQQVNGALLTAGHIVNPASQQRAVAAIQAVATIVSSMLALVQSVSTQAQVAHMATAANIKLAAVTPYLDNARAATIVAAHYGEPVNQAEAQIARAEQEQAAAGF